MGIIRGLRHGISKILRIAFWLGLVFFSITYLLLLFEAFPSMCYPSCDDPRSVRSLWQDVSSRIVFSMFCVLVFGNGPLSVREFYFLLRWRCFKPNKSYYHRRLTGFHREWYRLPGSDKLEEYIAPPGYYKKKDVLSNEAAVDFTAEEIEEFELNEALPLPLSLIPDPPFTRVRAPPTRTCYLVIVICNNMGGLVIQMVVAICKLGYPNSRSATYFTMVFAVIGNLGNVVLSVILWRERSRIVRIEDSDDG